MATITLVGLGPGDPMLLTRAAWEALQQAEIIYTPVPEHGALAEFAAQNKLRSFEVLAGGDDIEACTDILYTLAQEQGTLCCALPGNPLDARLTTGLVLITEVEEVSTLSVDIIAGVGMVDAVRGNFSVGNGGLQFWSFHEDLFFLGSLEAVNYRYHPNNEQFVRPWCEVQGIADYAPLPDWSALTPSLPAVIWIEKLSDAALLQEYLLEMSPANTSLWLLQHDYKGRQKNKQVTLGFLAESIAAMWDPQQVIAVFWVPGDEVLHRRTFESLHAVVVRLLGPGGCPWDVQQTHQSLRANLLEEVYEVLEALDSGDMAALAEELGDLLMQVLVHSEMARQAGYFAIGDVLEQIHTKLVRRHPHVFDDTPVRDESEVLSNWEQIKAHERAARGREHASSLDGVPAALPALAASQKTGKKAARAGFDWHTVEGARAKLREELAELDHAYQTHQQQASDTSRAHLTEELGDALYALAQVARWLDVDAESALREATAKFRRRFVRLEQTLQAEDHSLNELSLEEKVVYWNRARRETG